MAKLTDSGAAHLARALSADSSRPAPAAETHRRPAPAALARLSAVFSDPSAADALGHTLTISLAEYLNRPVRCSVTSPAPVLGRAVGFSAAADDIAWRVDVDAELAAAFGDAMIGGDGTAPLRQGKRIRSLAAVLAQRLLACACQAASLPVPAQLRVDESTTGIDTLLGGGLCAIATVQYGWRIGAAVDAHAMETPAEPEPASAAPAPAEIPRDRSTLFPDQPGSPHAEDPARVVEAALAALRTRVQELTHTQLAADEPTIAAHAGPDAESMPDVALRLALTAGGNGALVASLDREAVGALAGGAIGSVIPRTRLAGDVLVAQAEAILRDALAQTARRLPGIEGDGRKIVRLSEDPLPARTPHHAAVMRFAIGGRSGELRLLIPSWMLSNARRSEPRKP